MKNTMESLVNCSLNIIITLHMCLWMPLASQMCMHHMHAVPTEEGVESELE